MTRSLFVAMSLAAALLLAPIATPSPAGAVTINVNIGNGTNLNLGRGISCSQGAGFFETAATGTSSKKDAQGAQLRLPRRHWPQPLRDRRSGQRRPRARLPLAEAALRPPTLSLAESVGTPACR